MYCYVRRRRRLATAALSFGSQRPRPNAAVIVSWVFGVLSVFQSVGYAKTAAHCVCHANRRYTSYGSCVRLLGMPVVSGNWAAARLVTTRPRLVHRLFGLIIMGSHCCRTAAGRMAGNSIFNRTAQVGGAPWRNHMPYGCCSVRIQMLSHGLHGPVRLGSRHVWGCRPWVWSAGMLRRHGHGSAVIMVL